MNKSIEYIKRRVSSDDGNTVRMPIDGWDKASVVNPINYFKINFQHMIDLLKEENKIIFNFKTDSSEKEMEIIIDYNPDAEFDYFTMISTTHDGTLLFTIDALNDILERLFSVSTYKAEGVTLDFLIHTLDYDISYIIGDIIIHRDFGLKNINNNKMYGVTETIVLPIKFISTHK